MTKKNSKKKKIKKTVVYKRTANLFLPAWIEIIILIKKMNAEGQKEVYMTEIYKRYKKLSWAQLVRIVNRFSVMKYVSIRKQGRIKYLTLTEEGQKSIIF